MFNQSYLVWKGFVRRPAGEFDQTFIGPVNLMLKLSNICPVRAIQSSTHTSGTLHFIHLPVKDLISENQEADPAKESAS